MTTPSAREVEELRGDLAIAAAGIGTFDWDLVTGRLSWDDRLIEIFGYDRSSFDHSIDAFSARLHPDDRARVMTALQDAVAGGPFYDVEYRVVRPGGWTRWVQARGRPLRDATGSAVRFVGAALDTTELHEGQARVSRLLETMSSAFLSVDRRFRLTYMNAVAERMVGRPRAGFLGRDLFDAFPTLVGSPFAAAYLRAAETGEAQTVEGPAPSTSDTWFTATAHPTPDGLSIYLTDVTTRHVAQELVMLEARLGERLATSLDFDSVVGELARLVVPRLGDWSIVSLIGPDGGVRDGASWHVDPALRPVVTRYTALRFQGMGPGAPVMEATRSRQPQVVPSGLTDLVTPLVTPEAADALRELAPESAAVVPLVARGQLAGVLSVCRGAERPPLSRDELTVTVNLARRAAMALDNARLYADERRTAAGLQQANRRLQELVSHERTVARALQDAMLTRLPRTATVQLAARYLAAGDDVQVGGDWYDALALPDGSKVLVIGDVVGHDIQAAAVMGQLRNLLRAFAWDRDESPAATVARLDRASHELGIDTLATLTLVKVAAGSPGEPRRLTWTSAGHPPPVLIDRDGTARFLDQVADPLLGVLPGAERREQGVVAAPCSTLLLYTDGLVERRGVELDERRAELLAAASRHSGEPLAALLDGITTDLVGDANTDDVAVLAARFAAPD